VRKRGLAYPKVLDKIVKHAQAFWIVRSLNVDQRSDFGSLDIEKDGGG
jgi:hypothetical protein